MMRFPVLFVCLFYICYPLKAQVKATSSEINAGTDDNKFLTPLGLQGSKYLDQNGTKISATASGTANTYTATIEPAIASYSSGQLFYIKISASNTGPSTLNLNGLGVKALVKDATVALVSGDLIANKVYVVYYDGVNFQVLNAVTNSSNLTQTLSLGTAAGNIAISNGNNITLNNIGRIGVITDANTLPLYGFYPYGNITGSTNFPSATGAGIKMVRGDNVADGYFELNKPISNSDVLYYRVGTGATTFSSWQSIASREWAGTQFQPAYTMASNRLSGRFAATPGPSQDVIPGPGIMLRSSGTLYSGLESGIDNADTKVIKFSNPAGGQFKGVANMTGAIKIQLPTSHAVMYSIRGTLHQYDGAVQDNRTTSFLITCFSSNMDNGYSATFIGNNAPNYPVRWYTNGTKPAIYIGELASIWNYVTVTIDEVQASYRGTTFDIVSNGWGISLESEFTGTLAATQLNTRPSSNLNQPLIGYTSGGNVAITAVDNVLSAFGKTQAQMYNRAWIAGGAGASANSILASDTRNIDNNLSELTRGAWFDFKGVNSLALPGGTNWASLITMNPYSDASGTVNSAFRLAQSGGRMFFQYANSWTTWAPWREIWNSATLTNISQIATRNYIDLQNKPTTLAGFGITDAASQASVVTLDANAVHKTGNETITGTKLFNTSVGIGTNNTLSYKLAVGGGIIAESIKVKPQSGWADFVFDKDYSMLPLDELKQFILKNKHLPEIPTANEVKKEGIDLGEMNTRLLQKIEELTLYLIDLKKENKMLKKDTNKKIRLLSETVRKLSDDVKTKRNY